jgi:hypothetical protein
MREIFTNSYVKLTLFKIDKVLKRGDINKNGEINAIKCTKKSRRNEQ